MWEIFDKPFFDNFAKMDFPLDFGSRGSYHYTEDDDSSILYVNTPGYKSEDITVEMRGGRLSITGTPAVDRPTTLIPSRIDLHFTVESNMLVESASLSDGLLAIKLTRTNKTEGVKIPVANQ